MQYITRRTKQIVTCEKLIGRGGEGEVFSTSMPGIVAKIYFKEKSLNAEGISKLTYMINNPPQQLSDQGGHTSIIWPVDLLEHQGRVTGFVMPELSSAKNLATATVPQARKKDFPGFTWQYSLAIAHNLAWIFANIHDKGYVIGDVNDRNIQVTPQCMASILDTDSFQIKDHITGQKYPCLVSTPEFRAPELNQHMIENCERNAHQDNFSLAIMIFRLLFCGRHPFSGIPQGNKECLEISAAIKLGMTFLNPNAPILPPRAMPQLSILPPNLQSLFSRAFVVGHTFPEKRPSAKEWKDALAICDDLKNFRKCSSSKYHVYLVGKKCPWCALRDESRVDFYDINYKLTATSFKSGQKSLPTPQIRPSSTKNQPSRINLACSNALIFFAQHKGISVFFAIVLLVLLIQSLSPTRPAVNTPSTYTEQGPQQTNMAAERFIKKNSGVIYDTKTNLEWLVKSSNSTSWKELLSWINRINTTIGSGWRIPSRRELDSLMYSGRVEERCGSKKIVFHINDIFSKGCWSVWTKDSFEDVYAFNYYYKFSNGSSEKYINRDHCDGNCPKAFAVRQAVK